MFVFKNTILGLVKVFRFLRTDGVGDNEDLEPENPEINGPDDVYYLEKNDAMILATVIVILFAVTVILARRREPPNNDEKTESDSLLFA
jgi:hypothetical protein